VAVIRFKGNKLDPATIAALVTGTLVEGNVTAKWWKRQSADFLNGFMDEIRTSMQNGESLTQAITRVTGGTVDGVTLPGIMKTTKRKAGALVSTAMNTVANEAALQSYQLNADVIKWTTQVSTLDNRTSDICIAYSGQTWDIKTLLPVPPSTLPFNGGPARHFNCRSRLRPVTKSFRDLGIDLDEIPVSTRASVDGQVPADITFNQFLKKKSKTFQDDLLGKKRAELWRQDKINLTQLVDMRGNPMTLRQLEQRVGIKPKPDILARKPPRIITQDPEAGFKAALDAEKAKTAAARAAKKKADDLAAAAKQAERDAKAAQIRAERRAAREKARREAVEIREAEERAARIAKTEAEIAEREALKAGPDARIITDPTKIRKEAERFLLSRGVEQRHIFLSEEFVSLVADAPPGGSVTFGLAQKEALLNMVLPKIERELLAEAAKAAQLKRGIPLKAPDFKTLKAAQKWIEENVTNLRSNFARVSSKLVGDKNAYKLSSNVTLMMRDRFGLELPNYFGMRSRHPVYRFSRSSANQAVHMDSDSLLILGRGMNRQDRLEQAWSQWASYHGTGERTTHVIGKRTIVARQRGNRESVRRTLEELIEETDDPALKRALKATLKDDDWTFTVNGAIQDADVQFWKTTLHESGHRMHSQHRKALNDIWNEIRNPTGDYKADTRTYFKWTRATSRYSAKNREEFIAEQFGMYMSGRFQRVHPKLLKFFGDLDRGGVFDTELFNLHNGL